MNTVLLCTRALALAVSAWQRSLVTDGNPAGETEGNNDRLLLTHARVWALLYCLLLALCMIALVPKIACRFYGDSSAHILGAREILSGHLPFQGVMDTNPPAAMYLSTIPVQVADWLNLELVPAFNWFVVALALISGFLLHRFLVRLPGSDPVHADALVLLYLACNAFILDYSIHFGQREQLFVLFAVPWLALRALRWEGVTMPFAAALLPGLFMGAAGCMKHYFVLPVALAEISWIVRRRQWRPLLAPENWIAAGVIVAFVTHLFVLPRVREGLLHDWLPLVAHGYANYNANPEILWARFPMFPATLIAAFVPMLLRPARPIPLWTLAPGYSAFTLGALGVYFWQAKGFPYHMIPACFGVLLVFAVTALQVVARTDWAWGNRREWSTFRVLGLAGCLMLVFFPLDQFPGDPFFNVRTLLCLAALAGFLPLVFSRCWKRVGIIAPVCGAFLAGVSMVLFQNGLSKAAALKCAAVGLAALMTLRPRRDATLLQQDAANASVQSVSLAHVSLVAVYAIGAVSLIAWLAQIFVMPPATVGPYPTGDALLKYSRPGEAVLFISSGVDPGFPITVFLKRRAGSRYLVHFPITCIYGKSTPDDRGRFDYTPPPELADQEKTYLANLEADIRERRPSMIFVRNDGNNQGCPKYFDVLDYLENRGVVRRAFQGYACVGQIEACRVFVRHDRLPGDLDLHHATSAPLAFSTTAHRRFSADSDNPGSGSGPGAFIRSRQRISAR